MERQLTQVQKLLRHLRQTGTITNMEAQAIHKIRALPRRISDLEEMGYDIRRQHKTDTTGQRYVRYHFHGRLAA